MAKLIPYKLSAVGFCFLLLLYSKGVFAQNNYRLTIFPVDKDTVAISKLALKTVFQSKAQGEDYIQKLVMLLQSRGYLSSSVDSVSYGNTSATIHLFLGDKFQLDNINIHPNDEAVLNAVGWKLSALNNQQLNLTRYRLLQEKLLDYFENNGYPFARLRLDSIVLDKEMSKASLTIDRGILYRVDSIRLFGNTRISKSFLYRYLAIDKGSLYRRDKLAKINQRLLELPYLQQQQPWDVTMLSVGSIVNLYLQPKKSNQVNILAGFLPSNAQTGGKLLFTIDANLQLKNAFGSGESIGIVWQQIQPRSPRLNLQTQLPFIFNSPFGVDFSFELFKKDSTFLNINARAGLLYALSANQTGKIIIENRRTNVLTVDTFRVKASRALPDIADVSSVNVGLDYDLANTDYRFNPRRGKEFSLFIGAGSKKIRKNTTVTQIKDPQYNYERLYDTLKLNAYQFRMKAAAAFYIALGKQGVIKTAVRAGWYQSPNYFKNELFQIGGYNLLRGFDEEGIFASTYGVGTVEYRYLLGLNSYFSGFTDFGWSTDATKTIGASKNYIGAGVGLAFETKGGIFNISFAAGKRNDLPFDIRQAKIHFGYVSLF